MAPWGDVHFHPASPWWCEDFATASLDLQALLIHEMVHVWQTQTRGWWYLPLVRPFSRRYAYSLVPGWGLTRYGIEQQAEIVRHVFLLRQGRRLAGAPPLSQYDGVLPREWASA